MRARKYTSRIRRGGGPKDLRTLTILLVILTFSAGLTIFGSMSPVVNVFAEAATSDFAYAVAVDSGGNIIVAGTTESYGAGLDDVFVAKYSPSKVQLWSVTWGGTGSDHGYSVAVDSTDNIIVTGQTYSLGAGGADALVVKYSSSGVQLWNTTWGGGNSECGYGVTVDSANDVIVTGYTNSFGAGLDDVFLTKYSSSGVQLWSATWGGSYDDRSYGVAVDSIDNIVVTGYTDLSGTGICDALVVKYSSSGLAQWNLTMGGGNDFGYDAAVGSADAIIITGYRFSSATSSWDAFIAKCHSSGVKLWNRTWGGSYDDRSYGVAVDSEDNMVITGETRSFGAGGADAFVVKYSSSGVQLWNTTWGGSGDDYGYDVTVDPTNNTLVTGYTDSFGAGAGFYDAFILHVSTAPLWQTTWGKSTTDKGQNVAVDSTNNTIITGYTDSVGAGGLDAFVIKYSSSGVQLWNRTWGGGSQDLGYGVAVDSTDNMIMTGYTSSFGVGGYDAFVAKYSSGGVQIWNRTWGGGSQDHGYEVAVDSGSNIIMTGYTRSFGVGGYDAFIVKYSSSGVQLWNRTWGGGSHDYAYGDIVDSTGNIVVVGATESFGAGGYDAFVAKYSSSGVQLWNNTWQGSGSNYGYDVAIDSTNNIIITGHTYSFIEGIDDAFLVKYSSSGVQVWSRLWGGSKPDRSHGVAVDSADNIVMAGETQRSAADGIEAFVVKYSSLGTQLWSRVWGGSGSDYGYGVAIGPTNSIVMVGTTESFGAGSSDAVILKYPSLGFQFWQILWEAPGEKTHDVAIVNVNLSKTVVAQGYTVEINVSVTNQGETPETFDVTAYYNSTQVGTQTVTELAPNTNATLAFPWNTEGVPYGLYVTSANASKVTFEIDLTDNSFTDGTVTVTILGDVDGDGDVDYDDFIMLAGAYGSSIGEPAYRPEADFEGDGDVDYDDFIDLAGNYGKTI